LAYSTPPPCIPPPAPLGAAAVPSLAIAGPSVGTVVTAGSPLAVTVNASAEIAGVLLIIGVRGDEVFVLRRDTPGPTFEIAVPSELAGEQPLLAIGLDAAGRAIAASQPVTLTVAVAATLQSLSVYPPSLFLVQGETASLEVRGSYDDGVVRDLSRVATLDLSLATANARRSGVNLVTLDAPGDDTLTVALGGVAAAVVPITAYAVPPEAPQPRPVRRRLR
jgi:hypothetical protein